MSRYRKFKVALAKVARFVGREDRQLLVRRVVNLPPLACDPTDEESELADRARWEGLSPNDAARARELARARGAAETELLPQLCDELVASESEVRRALRLRAFVAMARRSAEGNPDITAATAPHGRNINDDDLP